MIPKKRSCVITAGNISYFGADKKAGKPRTYARDREDKRREGSSRLVCGKVSLTNSESTDIPHNLFLKGSTSYKPVYVNNLLLPNAMSSVHSLEEKRN